MFALVECVCVFKKPLNHNNLQLALCLYSNLAPFFFNLYKPGQLDTSLIRIPLKIRTLIHGTIGISLHTLKPLISGYLTNKDISVKCSV